MSDFIQYNNYGTGYNSLHSDLFTDDNNFNSIQPVSTFLEAIQNTSVLPSFMSQFDSSTFVSSEEIVSSENNTSAESSVQNFSETDSYMYSLYDRDNYEPCGIVSSAACNYGVVIPEFHELTVNHASPIYNLQTFNNGNFMSPETVTSSSSTQGSSAEMRTYEYLQSPLSVYPNVPYEEFIAESNMAVISPAEIFTQEEPIAEKIKIESDEVLFEAPKQMTTKKSPRTGNYSKTKPASKQSSKPGTSSKSKPDSSHHTIKVEEEDLSSQKSLSLEIDGVKVKCENSPQIQETIQNIRTVDSHHEELTKTILFVCDHCDKKFSGKCYFAQHMNVHHRRDKNFKCNICGKKFLTEEILATHVDKHRADKPHKCTMENCTRSFANNSDLLQHIHSNHEKNKAHKCRICSKGFARKDHLIKHLESHQRKESKKLQQAIKMTP